MKNQIILTTNPSNYEYSVESGLADNVRHFDHHKAEHRRYPSPCNNPMIKKVVGQKIAISHFDADTYLGLMRLCGIPLPKEIDLSLVEQIDLNGSSIIEGSLIYNDTYCYMVGLSQFARKYNFPRINKEEDIDVTEIIKEISEIPTETIISVGRESVIKSEEDYEKCTLITSDKTILISCGANDSIDPSRPYKDGFDIVVVYREHYETISLYASPNSPYTLNTEVASIEFAGHPKACGSPRGISMSLKEACTVFNELKEIPEV